MKSYLFFALLLTQRILFGQIYCPSGEIFQGPVNRVETQLYSREKRVLLGLEETPIILSELSTIILENGMLTQKSIKYPSGGLKCFCTNKYDTYGDLSERIIYAADSLVDVKKVFTHHSGKLIKTEYFNRKNQLFSTNVYQIDSLNFSAKSMEVFDNDDFEDLIYYTLNKDYLPIMLHKINESGNKILYKKIDYDTSRRAVKHYYYKDNSVESYLTYSYDEQNRVIESSCYDSNDKFLSIDSTYYDEHSNITYTRKHDSFNSISIKSVTYEYDKYGNYVSKMSWIGVGSSRYLVSKEIRTIIYD